MSCKLYLVPEDVILTWRSEQRENAIDKPIETVAKEVDTSMNDILDASTLSDYDKEKLFSQQLSKFLNLRKQQETAANHPLTSPPSSLSLQSPKSNHGDIMASIPKTYRNKAAGLLHYLQTDQDVSWDDQGHVSISKQRIDNRHIFGFDP